MSGLRKICKQFGSIKAKDADGKTVVHVWDYARDEPCLRSDMPHGSDRHKASEMARMAILKAELQATRIR
jgi:hypothetical protein